MGAVAATYPFPVAAAIGGAASGCGKPVPPVPMPSRRRRILRKGRAADRGHRIARHRMLPMVVAAAGVAIRERSTTIDAIVRIARIVRIVRSVRIAMSAAIDAMSSRRHVGEQDAGIVEPHRWAMLPQQQPPDDPGRGEEDELVERSAHRPAPAAMVAAAPTTATPRTPRHPARPVRPANRICRIRDSPRSLSGRWRSTPGRATGAWCSSPIHILCTNKNEVRVCSFGGLMGWLGCPNCHCPSLAIYPWVCVLECPCHTFHRMCVGSLLIFLFFFRPSAPRFSLHSTLYFFIFLLLFLNAPKDTWFGAGCDFLQVYSFVIINWFRAIKID